MGQTNLPWDALGRHWDTVTHMNFAELCTQWFFKVLIKIKKIHALGRSLSILNFAVSRS